MSEYEPSNDAAGSIGDEYDVVARFSDTQPGYAAVPEYGDGYVDGAGYELDEYDDDDTELLDELVDSRVEEELTRLMEPNMAENYWARREAEKAAEAEAEYARTMAEVRPKLDALLEQTGRKFGVVESARSGQLEAYANQLLATGQHAARVAGWSEADQAKLYEAQTAVNALEMAAEALRVRAVTDLGLNIVGGGKGPTPSGGTRHV